MEKLQIFRIFVLIISIFGFILCFITLPLPNWISVSNAEFNGYYGMFTFCIDNYGGNVICSTSDVTPFNVGGFMKTTRVFMCLGFAAYFIHVTLATMTFFWSKRWKVIRGIKFAAGIFATSSAILLMVAVAVVEINYDRTRETLSYGWFLSVVSFVIAAAAVPSYLCDACYSAKPNTDKQKSVMCRETQTQEFHPYMNTNVIDINNIHLDTRKM